MRKSEACRERQPDSPDCVCGSQSGDVGLSEDVMAVVKGILGLNNSAATFLYTRSYRSGYRFCSSHWSDAHHLR